MTEMKKKYSDDLLASFCEGHTDKQDTLSVLNHLLQNKKDLSKYISLHRGLEYKMLAEIKDRKREIKQIQRTRYSNTKGALMAFCFNPEPNISQDDPSLEIFDDPFEDED